MGFRLANLVGLKLIPGPVPVYGDTHNKIFPERIPFTLVALCFANSLVKLAIPLILQETYSAMSAQNISYSQYLLLVAIVIIAIAASQLLLIAYGLVLSLYRFNVKRQLCSRILQNNFRDYKRTLQLPIVDLKSEHANMQLWMKVGTKISVYLHNYYESYLNLVFECFNIIVIIIYLIHKLSFSLLFGLAVAGLIMFKTIRVAAKMNDIRFKNIDLRKRRLQILEYFFNRISEFKMCWLDKWFYDRVTKIEQQFQQGLRNIKILDCWCVALWQFTSVAISSIVICTYYLIGFNEGVDKDSVFSPSTFVYLLNMLNFPLNALSWYIAGIKTAQRAIRQIAHDIRIQEEIPLSYKKISQEAGSICVLQPIELQVKREHQSFKINIPVKQFRKGRIYSIIGQFSQQLMQKWVFLLDQQLRKSYVEENTWLAPSAIDSFCMEQSITQIQKHDRRQLSCLMELFLCHDIPLSTNTEHYSGGEKLRISLVRAFHLGEIIVINTNLNSLDKGSKLKVLANIRKLVDGVFLQIDNRYTVFIRDNQEFADEILSLIHKESAIQILFCNNKIETTEDKQSQIKLSNQIASYMNNSFAQRLAEEQVQKMKKNLQKKGDHSQSAKSEKSLVTLDTFKIYYTSKKHIVFAVSMLFVTFLSNYYNYFINTYIDFSQYHSQHVVFIIFVTLLLAFGLFFRSYYFADANLDEASRICHNLNQNIIMNQLSFYQSEQKIKETPSINSKSRLICALTSDTQTIADQFPFSTNIFANNITVIISSMIVILMQVPYVLLLMVFLIYYCKQLNRTSHKWDEDMKMAIKQKDVKLYRLISDIEGGRKYLIIHNRVDRFNKLYSNLREELIQIEWLSEKYRSYINLKYKVAMIIFLLVAVAVYSVFNVVFDSDLRQLGTKTAKSSGLALLIQYTIQLSNYLLHFTMSVWQIRGQALSIQRVRPYLDQKDSIKRRIASCDKVIAKIRRAHKSDRCEHPTDTKLIEIRNLTFAYECNPETLIFEDLHFSVKMADKIIIRGRSGSGKTTLYKLLTSAYPHVIDFIQSPHLISFSPQHPLSLPDTSSIKQIINPYAIQYNLPEVQKYLQKHGLTYDCEYEQLTYQQKIIINNLRAYVYGYNGIVIYDEPQLVISQRESATYLIVTHHHDFKHNVRLNLVDGKLVAVE